MHFFKSSSSYAEPSVYGAPADGGHFAPNLKRMAVSAEVKPGRAGLAVDVHPPVGKNEAAIDFDRLGKRHNCHAQLVRRGLITKQNINHRICGTFQRADLRSRH